MWVGWRSISIHILKLSDIRETKKNLKGEIDVVVPVNNSIFENDIVENNVEEAKRDHFEEIVSERVQGVEIFDEQDPGQIVEGVTDQKTNTQQDFYHKVGFELAEGRNVSRREGIVFCHQQKKIRDEIKGIVIFCVNWTIILAL